MAKGDNLVQRTADWTQLRWSCALHQFAIVAPHTAATFVVLRSPMRLRIFAAILALRAVVAQDVPWAFHDGRVLCGAACK